eukprot:CAMPEP_0176504662 /NCGR_PEP_ID=MMETSP0200_2-20121128/16060_1 /TAXON_ID=947934 /ORGANISM="Chaetoceros sp., Strain GSL56" /LENGTH=882 /DNA_ID=CAMNT_0017904123 /DNA_START=370 /DNA_END=3018 /DNA_ORIENTATION=+
MAMNPLVETLHIVNKGSDSMSCGRPKKQNNHGQSRRRLRRNIVHDTRTSTNNNNNNNNSAASWSSWSVMSLLLLAVSHSSSSIFGPIVAEAFVPASESSAPYYYTFNNGRSSRKIRSSSSSSSSSSGTSTVVQFRFSADDDDTSASTSNAVNTSKNNSILKNAQHSIRKTKSRTTATNASVSSIPSLTTVVGQTTATLIRTNDESQLLTSSTSKLESISAAATTRNPSVRVTPGTNVKFYDSFYSSSSSSSLGSVSMSDMKKNDTLDHLMPSWLRPSGDAAAEKLVHLREVMNHSESYLSQLEAEQVISAIKEASGGDVRKIEGAVDFCLVLVETMEMGVATLIAAAFHYCDAYAAREQSASAQVGRAEQFSHADYWTKQNQQDCINNDHQRSSRAIKIGQDAHQLIMDAARIKRAEMVASESLKSRPSPTESAHIRKMLLSETHDWRALAIRSAACLYRLRGIYQHFECERKKQSKSQVTYSHSDLRVAREALEIHAPLASRLGMHRLKNEIEGGAFRILYRRQYEKVTSLTHLNKPCKQDECDVSTFKDGMRTVLDKVTREVDLLLQNDPCFTKYVDQYKVSARVKESYSLWKKMKLKLKADSIMDVPDALALRIVFEAKKMTPDEDDEVTRARDRALCYYVQQTCTKKFKPLGDGRFKDYIARPKPNGYQSLHYTAVTEFESDQWPFEIQVRSVEMHHVAEFGLAAHWDYKSYESGDNTSTDASQAHYAFKLDNSSDAYLRSVQEWHWQQAQARGSWLTDTSSSQVHQRNDEMTERIRARDERLAPYLDALKEDHSNLAREHVFIFMSCNDNDDGHVLELPAGSCVLDALRESERSLGFTSNRTLEKQIVHNGSLTTVTQLLRNGDIITIPNMSSTMTR